MARQAREPDRPLNRTMPGFKVSDLDVQLLDEIRAVFGWGRSRVARRALRIGLQTLKEEGVLSSSLERGV